MEIHGHCDPRFDEVRDAFVRNFTEHGDVGASFAATVDGEYVIDIWGGHCDAKKTMPWTEDTIVCVYSTTKTMTFLCALMLADRGELDLNAPVVKYWPEYGQQGKAGTEVRHFLSHTAAVPGFEPAIKGGELYDWERCVANLAAQKPWWKIGEQSGYHAVTQGFLIGEIVRRITGKSFGTFFKEEVAAPLGADFHIGVATEELHRIGEIIPDESPLPEGDNPFANIAPGSVPDRLNRSLQMDDDAVHTTEWRQAEIPAANGHGNARSVVRAQTALANGGRAFGVELLSSAGCERLREVQIEGEDLLFGFPLKFGMGYAYPAEELSPVSDTAMFWGGAGGSSIVVDLERHVCLSYVMNRMSNSIFADKRSSDLGKAVYRCLDV